MLVRFPRIALTAACVGLAAQRAGAQQTTQRADSTPRQTHVVKPGDTLWDLAHTYLGDPYRWPDIFRLNTGTIQNPHWIYPGEVLRLPLAAAESTSATPTSSAQGTTALYSTEDTSSTVFSPRAPDTTRAMQHLVVVTPPQHTVNFGEYLAAPWIDARGGPHGAGSILRGADIPGIGGGAARDRLQDYDRVLFSPPAGVIDPSHTRYLAYTLGPLIEGVGQIIQPTGVVEISEPARAGVAGVATVVKVFGEMAVGQPLLPFDSSIEALRGEPQPVSGGRVGQVIWISGEPVLPTVQHYVVVDLNTASGVSTGDELELYRPVQHFVDPPSLASPEEIIARAQVLRVTPQGATAVIVQETQPAIHDGVAVRVVSKMR